MWHPVMSGSGTGLGPRVLCLLRVMEPRKIPEATLQEAPPTRPHPWRGPALPANKQPLPFEIPSTQTCKGMSGSCRKDLNFFFGEVSAIEPQY